MLHAEFPAENVTMALETVLEKGPPSVEAIRQVMLNSQHIAVPAVRVPSSLAELRTNPVNLGCYDQLMKRRIGDS